MNKWFLRPGVRIRAMSRGTFFCAGRCAVWRCLNPSQDHSKQHSIFSPSGSAWTHISAALGRRGKTCWVPVLADVAERIACFKLYPCSLASNVKPHEEAEFSLSSRSKRCSYTFLANGSGFSCLLPSLSVQTRSVDPPVQTCS